MGLGKTVQCVSMLGVLSELAEHRGPFLVVVPLSVVPNWAKEFKKWTPEVCLLSSVFFHRPGTAKLTASCTQLKPASLDRRCSH